MSRYDLLRAAAKKTDSSSQQKSQKTQKTQEKNQQKSQPTQQNQQKAQKAQRVQTKKTYQPTSDYWQAQQQTQNQKQTSKVRIAEPKKQYKVFTQADKNRAQREGRYASALRKEQNSNASREQTYSQASAGIDALLHGRNVGEAMRNVSDWQTTSEQKRALAQAKLAQKQNDEYRKLIDSNDLTKTFSDLGLSAIGGLSNSVGGGLRAASNVVQGIGGLIGNKEMVEAGRKFDQELGIEQAIENVRKNNTMANTYAGKIAENIGGMIPTIASGIATGGGEALGLGLMGLSAFGNEGSEALNNLSADGDLTAHDSARALTTGALKGGLEVATEKLSSIVPGLETFAWTNPDHLIGQLVGEGLEEAVSATIEPYIDPLANPNIQMSNTPDIHGRYGLDYGQEAYNNTFGDVGGGLLGKYGKDIWDSAVMGAATSLAMGAGNIANTTNNKLARQINESSENWTPKSAEPTTNKALVGGTSDAFKTQNVQVTPEAKPVQNIVPEDYQAVASDEDTITDGIYKPEAEMAEDTANQLNAELQAPEAAETTQPTEEVQETEPTAPEQTEVTEPKTPQKTVDDFKTKTEEIVKKVKDIPDASEETVNKAAEDIVNSYNEAVEQVASDLPNVPKELLNSMIGGEKITQGAIKQSEGRTSGEAQEFQSAQTTKEFKEKVKKRTNDVTYLETHLDPLTATAQQMYDRLGGEKATYDDFMSKNPAPLRSALGIKTNYAQNIHIAEGQYLADRIELRKNSLMDEIQKKGIEVKSVENQDGTTTFTLTKDGKPLNSEESKKYISDLNDATSKLNAIYTKLNNTYHNAALTLRQAWYSKMTPSAQIKGIQENVNKINREMEKKFGSKIRSGELSPVSLNQDLVKQYLEATDDVTRAKIVEQMAFEMASQVPHSVMEKIDAFRYNNLLFNPLTWIRNGFGNFGQSKMAQMKNVMLYGIESLEKSLGRVRYNNIDPYNESDAALFNHTKTTAGDTLSQDFLDGKTKGNVKKHLKSLGYEGDLLNRMAGFKGDTFSLSTTDNRLNARFIEKVSNNLKDAGYTVKDNQIVDKNGNEMSHEDYVKLLNESFHQAKRQFISADSLRMAKRDSAGMARVNKTQYELWHDQGFDTLNPMHESVAGLMNEGKSAPDAFMAAYNEARRQNVFSNNNLFGKWENWRSKGIDYMMNKAPFLGDQYWMRKAYAKNMSQMLDAQGCYAEINDGKIDLYDRNGDKISDKKAESILNDINADAYRRALEDTYHDPSAVADILNQLRGLNPGTDIMMGALQPFIKTPINIAKRSVEYSPAGFAYSFKQLNDVKKGKMSAETWLNSASKGATGVTAAAFGFILAAFGILKANGDEEDDEITNFESKKGVQNYSIQLPDGTSVSVDWLAPGIAPFLIGAATYEAHQKYAPADGNYDMESTIQFLTAFLENSGSIFQPLLDTTMMSGLVDNLSVFGEADKSNIAGKFISKLTENYTRQFTPAAGSKVAGIFDGTKYSTASDNFLDRQIRSAAINFRLIDMALSKMNGKQYLQPQLDLNGEPIQTEDYGLGMAGRAFTNLLNPATVKRDTRDKTDLEMERLYKATGNTGVLPEMQTYLNNTKFKPEERTEYNEYYLSEYKKAAEEFIQSDAYRYYDDKERASILNSMSSHFKAEATKKYLGRIVPNSDSVLTTRDKACDYVGESGVSAAKFYSYLNTDFELYEDGEHINNTRAMKIRAQMEADGVWERVKEAVNNGWFQAGDFNLNKTVLGWDTSDFTYYYQLMLDHAYDPSPNRKKKKK